MPGLASALTHAVLSSSAETGCSQQGQQADYAGTNSLVSEPASSPAVETVQETENRERNKEREWSVKHQYMHRFPEQ